MAQTFKYSVDRRFVALWGPTGLRPSKHGVVITDDDRLVATFGFFSLAAPLANITGAHITTDYRWWKAIGIRMSLADDGLTLGTCTAGGVCIHFAEKVPSALRRSGHSALTVTVEDLEGLTSALSK